MSTITFRTDDEIDKALAELSGNDSRMRSQAIRDAILFAARERRRERLRAEARALAADEEDRAEIRAVQAQMEPLRAW